jgi:hypothetical protein
MRALHVALALASSLALTACVTVPTPRAPEAVTCQCTAQSCPVDRCDLQIDIEAGSCAGQVSVVEVEIGGQLEPRLFRVGQPQRTCVTLARGSSAQIVARAATPDGAAASVPEWLWQETVTCPAAQAGEQSGPTIARVFQCNASK